MPPTRRAIARVSVLAFVMAVGACGGGGRGGGAPTPEPSGFVGPFALTFESASGRLDLPPGTIATRIASIDASVGAVAVAGDGTFAGLPVTQGAGGLLLWLLDAQGSLVASAYDEGAPWIVGPDEVLAGLALLTSWGFSVTGGDRPVYLAALRQTSRYARMRGGLDQACRTAATLLDESQPPWWLADVEACAREAFERLVDPTGALGAGATPKRSAPETRLLTSCGPLPTDVPQVAVAAGTHEGRCSVWALNPSSVFCVLDLQRDQDLVPMEPILVAPKQALVNLDWFDPAWRALNPQLLQAYPPAASDMFPSAPPAPGSYQARAFKGRTSQGSTRAGELAGALNSIYAAVMAFNLVARLEPAASVPAFALDWILGHPDRLKEIALAMLSDTTGSELLRVADEAWRGFTRDLGVHLFFDWFKQDQRAPSFASFIFQRGHSGLAVNWAEAMRRGWSVTKGLQAAADVFLGVSIANRYVPAFWDLLTRPFEVDTCFTIDGAGAYVPPGPDCTRLTPIPVFSWSPLVPEPGQAVRFDAAGTIDDDTVGLEYWWDFDRDDAQDGDTGWSAGRTATHVYPTPGLFTVTLRVRDGEGEGMIRRLVRVGAVVPDLQAAVEVPTGLSPFDLAHADLDADGDADLVVGLAGTGEVEVLENRGDGTFTLAASLTGPGRPCHVAVGDVDRDGRPDIVAGLEGGAAILPFRNTGGLTFEAQAPLALPVGGALRDLHLRDVDGVAGPDLVLADSARGTVEVWLSDGGFAYPDAAGLPHRVLSLADGPRALALGDLDLDGNPDIVVACFAGDTLAVVRGTGAGAFQVTQTGLPAGAATYGGPDHVAIGDVLVGAGPEVVVTNARGSSVSLFRRNVGAPTLSLEPAGVDWILPAPSGPVRLADVDADGRADLVRSRPEGWGVWVHYLDGTWPPAALPLDLATGVTPVALEVLDANGDGLADLATANAGTNSVSVLLGAGGRAFRARRDLHTRADPGNDEPYDAAVARLYAADFDPQAPRTGVGGDLAVVTHASERLVLFRNRDGHGDLRVEQTLPLAVGSQPLTLAVGDLDGDQVPEIAVACFTAGTVAVFRRQANGLYALQEDVPVASQPLRLAIEDVDGQGSAELVVMHYSPGLLAAYAYHASTSPALTLVPGSQTGGTALPHGLASGDLDGDAFPDYATTNYFNGTVSVFHGRADGALVVDPTGPSGMSEVIAVAIGDVNHDTRGDVVVVGGSGGHTFLGVPGGRFSAALPFDSGIAGVNQANHVRLADVDGDGHLDILVEESGGYSGAGEPRDRLSVVYGDGDGTFPRRVQYLAGFGPIAIALGDVDGDGRADVVTCSWHPDASGAARVVSVLRHR